MGKAWWWTRRLGGWPFSAKWLPATFDANVGPFSQSFIEVRVEPSKGRIRLLGGDPGLSNGRRNLQSFKDFRG